ncbi:small GTP-binding protein [Coprobacillus cateniformis]|uniref:Small GTP-binding protein n=3 Tax=Coprobacillus cateniformis TaxID=100884 RepID=E7GA28_9FIRM|nr:GTP-binding protein [Coprobacillus cateniformis]EFW05036.1 small GTP-binding protein [Coprobacillus cateniformis]
MRKCVIGTLAHVDAGKTTLTESLLYLAGSIRKLGRVDHGDAFLDYDSQERVRGITIFSKQSLLRYKDVDMTLIDTPGHVDFSAEMERTLQILDYAIIVISGLDGVQAHTETIWNLLNAYHIPTFLFINKMDISHYEKSDLMKDLKEKLDERCVDLTSQDDFYEDIALCDDMLLDYYLEHQTLTNSMIQDAVENRKVFPCFFGSALKMKEVDSFLEALTLYTKEKR